MIKKSRALIALFFLSHKVFASLTPLQVEPLKEFSAILKTNAELSDRYKLIIEKIQGLNSDLEIHFVVGNANPNFITIDQSLWDMDTKLESFSKADALGRLLCPGHPLNPGKKFALIVRADDPGDTLLHEYLHLQQIRSDATICDLYKRLEVNPSPADLRRNIALEYEVIRFILENKKSFPVGMMAEASIIEKILKYSKEAPEECLAVEKTYKWRAVSAASYSLRLLEIMRHYSYPINLSLPYQVKDTDLKSEKSDETGFINRGISVFKKHPTPKSIKTFCVFSKNNESQEIIDAAIKTWNDGVAQVAPGKIAFKSQCQDNPKIEVRFNDNSGLAGDGIIKLGILFQSTSMDTQIILLRKREIRSQKNLIAALVRKEKIKNPEKAAEFEAFLRAKTENLALNLVAHELGHALGLAHNFNERENSIMNYSSETKLSDYDLDGLRLLYLGADQVKGHWEPKIK